MFHNKREIVKFFHFENTRPMVLLALSSQLSSWLVELPTLMR